MKSIKFLIAILFFSTFFMSCSNSETDEELQMLINCSIHNDTGDDPLYPIPPEDPKDED